MRKVINTGKAPKAIGPYSQAVEANGFLFASGQIPINPETGIVAEGGIEQQTKQVLANVEAILKEKGLSFAAVVKTTVFITDMNDFAAVKPTLAGSWRQKPSSTPRYAF